MRPHGCGPFGEQQVGPGRAFGEQHQHRAAARGRRGRPGQHRDRPRQPGPSTACASVCIQAGSCPRSSINRRPVSCGCDSLTGPPGRPSPAGGRAPRRPPARPRPPAPPRRPRPVRGTQRREKARPAGRFLRVAHPAPVEDRPVGEQRPLSPGQLGVQLGLDLHRVGVGGQAPPADQPGDMRVDGDPGNPEGMAEHHVRGLAAEPRQGDQLGQGGRELAVEPLHQRLTEPDQRAGLVPEEAGGLDHLFQLGPRRRGVVGGGAIAGEQRRGDHVHAGVGGLGGQDGGHRQLQRRGEVQLAVRVRIAQFESAGQLPGPAGPRQRRRGACFDRCVRRRRVTPGPRCQVATRV